MYVVEITNDKIGKMSEYAEKMLRYGGKLMQCIDSMSEESGMHHRGGYGNRYGEPIVYGNRYGMVERTTRHSGRMDYRDSEDWDDDMEERYEEMGERRRRDSRGRYI